MRTCACFYGYYGYRLFYGAQVEGSIVSGGVVPEVKMFKPRGFC